jgi:hypothetical protein
LPCRLHDQARWLGLDWRDVVGYLTAAIMFVSIAGKAPAGYSDPRQKVAAPSLDAISQELSELRDGLFQLGDRLPSAKRSPTVLPKCDDGIASLILRRCQG